MPDIQLDAHHTAHLVALPGGGYRLEVRGLRGHIGCAYVSEPPEARLRLDLGVEALRERIVEVVQQANTLNGDGGDR